MADDEPDRKASQTNVTLRTRRGLAPGATVAKAIALPGTNVEQPASATPHDADTLDEGTLVAQRYRIGAKLGHGAFGAVYRADDVQVPGHVVALKILHEPAGSQTEREGALRELRLIASVFHPSVVMFKDHGWHKGRFFFVMPWYEGETLAARLERDGNRGIARAEALRIFVPLARGLASMHAAGVRHQDIKPENIFLARVRGINPDGSGDDVLPVLLDLGVAATDEEHLFAGTVDYFAPEVAAWRASTDFKPATSKSDVFALALSLRNALEPETGDHPGEDLDAFMLRRNREVPPLPQRSDLAYLAPHFRRWLAVDPDARPSADRFAEELSVLVAPEARARRRRDTLRLLVPAAMLVVALCTLVYALDKKVKLDGLQLREREAMIASTRARAERDSMHSELVQHRLQDQLERTRTREIVSESTISTLRSQIELESLSNADLVQRLADATGRTETLRMMLNGVRADLDTRTSERDQALVDVAARTTERDQLGATVAMRTRERDALSVDVGQRSAERDHALAELAARTTERDEAHAVLATRTHERDEAHTELAARTTERDTLRAELAARVTERDQLRAELAARTAQRDQLAAHLDEAQRAAHRAEHNSAAPPDE